MWFPALWDLSPVISTALFLFITFCSGVINFFLNILSLKCNFSYTLWLPWKCTFLPLYLASLSTSFCFLWGVFSNTLNKLKFPGGASTEPSYFIVLFIFYCNYSFVYVSICSLCIFIGNVLFSPICSYPKYLNIYLLNY